MQDIIDVKLTLNEYSAGENAQTFIPAHYKPGSKPPVIYCHTTGASVKSVNYPGVFGQYDICSKIAGMGFPVVFGDLGVPDAAPPNDGKRTWGNAVGRARIRTILAGGIASGLWANLPGLLVSASMGNTNALQELVDHPADWAGLVSVLGVSDLVTDYGRADLAFLQADIAGAWGVVAPAALPAGANTLTRAATIAALKKPYLAFYSVADTTILPTETEALRAVLGGKSVNVGNQGHTEAGIQAAANRPELADFIRTIFNI